MSQTKCTVEEVLGLIQKRIDHLENLFPTVKEKSHKIQNIVDGRYIELLELKEILGGGEK